MTRNTVVLIVGASLAVVGAYLDVALLGEVPHAKGEPAAAVCHPTGGETNVNDMRHNQSCLLGYTAMYVPKRPAADCQELYERDATIYGRSQPLFQSDYITGCEAAQRQLIAEITTGSR